MHMPATVVERTVQAARRAGESRVAAIDARVLLGHVLGWTHAGIIAGSDRALSEAQWRRYCALIARRAAGEPVAYLVGTREFHGLEFEVTADVLVPRPETEHVVEQVLARAPEHAPCSVLDLGTGSGAIAVALAVLRPRWDVCAVDVSTAALAVARRNAARHAAGVRFARSDWFSALAGERFDVIAANPPYVAAGDGRLCADGLAFEPQGALVAGPDGMECIRTIAAQARHHLRRRGSLVIEHGYDQRDACIALLCALGYAEVRDFDDLAGVPRVCVGRWSD